MYLKIEHGDTYTYPQIFYSLSAQGRKKIIRIEAGMKYGWRPEGGSIKVLEEIIIITRE